MGRKSWRKVTSLMTVLAFAVAIAIPQGASAQEPAPAAQPAPAASAQPATQPAQPDDQTLATAKAHFEAGKSAYGAGDYQRAITEFKAAARLRPSPILDYNIGLAHEKLGHRRVAVKYYQRYLAGMPNAPNRAEVEANIATLQQAAAAQPEPQPAPQPEAQPEPQPQSYPTYGSYDPYAPTPAQYPTQAPKKKKSRWWIGLIIAGGVLLVVGIVVAVAVVEYQATNSVVYGAALDSPLRAPPPTGPSAHAPELGGIQFRF